jgi:hypothetical protein
MKRFAAKLLFQYRVVVDGPQGKIRICEERIVTFLATSPSAALKTAAGKGTKAKRNYLNDEGNKVFFEFVGVMDLLKLGSECEPDEVWYDINKRMLPMERRRSILPSRAALLSRA